MNARPHLASEHDAAPVSTGEVSVGAAFSFEHVVSQYQSMIFGLCLRLLGHRQDAEDMTQETFSRFYRYQKHWDPQRPLGPYLRTIAGNRCRTLMSRRGRRLQSLETAAEPQTIADDQARRAAWLNEELKLALTSLPEKQRRAFELFHGEAMAYAEIAEALDCPLGSVKTWVHRARGALIEHLRDRDVIGGGDAAGGDSDSRNGDAKHGVRAAS